MNAQRVVVPWLLAAVTGCSVNEAASFVQKEQETGVSGNVFPLADPLNRVFAPLNTAAQKFFAGTCVVRLKDKDEEEVPEEKDVKTNTTTAELVVRYARNRSAVDNSFAIGGSVEAQYGLAAGKAELKTANETNTRSDAIYLTAELTALLSQNAAESCPLAISKTHTALLMEDQGAAGADAASRRAARFIKNCGNTYVHLEQRGLIATIQLSLVVTDQSRKDEIEAAVEAGFRTPMAGAKAVANLKSLTQTFNQSLKFQAVVTTAGFTPTIDKENLESDPAGALEKLLREAQEVAKMGGIDNAVPISARLGYYADLEPFRGRFAKNGETRIYKDEQIERFAAAQAEIKNLIKRMEDFLVPRRQLLREMDTIQAQVKYITETAPERFSYDGTQKAFDERTTLPIDRDKPDDFPDVVKYTAAAQDLAKQLKAEMDACVENGEGGFEKCKEGSAAPAADKARTFIKKWRKSRPRPVQVYVHPKLARNKGEAVMECDLYDLPNGDELKGKLIRKAHVRYARHLIKKLLAAQSDTAAWVEEVTANLCPKESPMWLGLIWVPETNTFRDICAQKQPKDGVYPAACVSTYEYRNGKKVQKDINGHVWHDAFWGDELAVP